jgi:hypothetical protein
MAVVGRRKGRSEDKVRKENRRCGRRETKVRRGSEEGNKMKGRKGGTIQDSAM